MKKSYLIFLFISLFLFTNVFVKAQSKSLIDCLESLHYSSIQLTPNMYGHFEMEAMLDGKHPIVLIVDTGSSMSLLSKSLLDSVGYVTHPVPDPEGRELWRVRVDSLTFGKANTGRKELIVGNLDELFPGFDAYGKRIHGLIGSDLLSRYSALIDIEWSRLYLLVR
ncbi:MAG: aspartyl protease family protein [bacterium]